MSRGGRTGGRGRGAALAVGPLVFLALFFAWPLTLVLSRGLGVDGALLAPLRDVLTDPYLQQVARFTLGQALASTLLTLLVGMPVAAVLSTLDFRGRRVIEAATIVPFVLPTVVVGTAFVALLGRLAPVVDLRQTTLAILLAHVFFNVSVVVRTVGGLWRHLDAAPVLAARTLGATRLRAFLHVTLPRLRPAIGGGGRRGLPLHLHVVRCRAHPGRTGPARRSRWRSTVRRPQLLDLRTAAALSVLQLLAVVATLGVYDRTRRRHAGPSPRACRAEPATGPPVRANRMAIAGMLGLLMLVQGLPLLALLERSLRVGDGWGLAPLPVPGCADA